jgi:uncharacterized cupredoxin-like copper-binding protein
MKTHHATIAAVMCLSAIAAHAHPGGHGDPLPPSRDFVPAPPARTVAIEMTDRGCNPSEVVAAPGETIRFASRNSTKVVRDLALGSAEELKAHAEIVRKFPGMQSGKGARVSVTPGESAELVWKAPNRGRLAISCAAPGQFEAAAAGWVVVGKP